MKKLLPVLALCMIIIFLLNSGGIYVFMASVRAGEKMQLWRQIENGLCADMTMQVRIASVDVATEANGFKWEEEGKEFRLNGNMYDVVKSERSGDNIIFTCVNDTREEAMNSMVSDILMQQYSNNQDKKNQACTLLELVPKHYMPAQFKLFFSENKLLLIQHDHVIDYALTGHAQIQLPPPKYL